MNKTTACLVLVGTLMLANTVGAQTAEEFAGDWKPTKERGALAELKIVKEGSAWVAHAYGSCTPNPCDWGPVQFIVLQQRPEGRSAGLAIWKRGTSTRYVTMHLGEDVLVIEIYNLFSGPRDQPSYLTVGQLSKPGRPAPNTPAKK